MSKKVIITGGYGSIGEAIVKKVSEAGNKVYVLGRDEKKLMSCCERIKSQTCNENVFYELVDLSIEKSINELSNRWKGDLDVLINNAATTPPLRTETADGIETQWATNVLGYYWMMIYMHRFMKDVSHARIVNVASYWAGDLDLKDPEFTKRYYNNDTAYRQSKQADRMLTIAFAEKLRKYGIIVNACHPGDVRSKLSTNLGYGGFETPEQGAETPVWCALSDDIRDISGGYFENKKKIVCRFSDNRKSIVDLLDLCISYSK